MAAVSSGVATRRWHFLDRVRGLKPTATVAPSLREASFSKSDLPGTTMELNQIGRTQYGERSRSLYDIPQPVAQRPPTQTFRSRRELPLPSGLSPLIKPLRMFRRVGVGDLESAGGLFVGRAEHGPTRQVRGREHRVSRPRRSIELEAELPIPQ